MGASKVVDAFVAYQFIKLLSTPWEETKAYKLGIIDDKGNLLKKSRELRTREEKAAYTMVHRLVWNIKRLLDKLPPTRTRIGSFATALWMLREHSDVVYGADFNLSHKCFQKYLQEQYNISPENLIYESRENIMTRGRYRVKFDVDGPGQGTRVNDTFTLTQDIKSDDVFAGEHIFSVTNDRTKETMFVSHDDVEGISLNEWYDLGTGSEKSKMEYLINPEPRNIKKLFRGSTGSVRWMGDDKFLYLWNGYNYTHADMERKIKEKGKYYGSGMVNKQGKIQTIRHISNESYANSSDDKAMKAFSKYLKNKDSSIVADDVIYHDDRFDDEEDLY